MIIYGANLDAAPHRHHAIQLIWPLEGAPCQLNGKEASALTIIDANVEHQLQMPAGWVLLVEPKSQLGQELSLRLAGEGVKTFGSPFPYKGKTSTKADDASVHLSHLFKELGLTTSPLLLNEARIRDKRIQQLLSELDNCLQGECIKPSHWRASSVASHLTLSESRFLHIFSEEMGIAWRPYLLWRRMICAIQAILNNSSATDAAYLAGFSDSAHLSRTFKKTFGMTIRQAQTLFKKG